ncbi:hypothetical protein [Paludisphaera sp.]|uniref:hypothetical protein n=1 Tax=Paludisphaera sp. TaxID=2017432 RepID=UPI00301C413D
MPRLPRGNKPHRLNLEMSEQVHSKLIGLLDRTGADSQAEVVRRALALYDFIWTHVEEGSRIIVKQDSSEHEVRLI